MTYKFAIPFILIQLLGLAIAIDEIFAHPNEGLFFAFFGSANVLLILYASAVTEPSKAMCRSWSVLYRYKHGNGRTFITTPMSSSTRVTKTFLQEIDEHLQKDPETPEAFATIVTYLGVVTNDSN